VGSPKYRRFKKNEISFDFTIIDLIHSPGKSSPVAVIQYEDNQKDLYLPPEGIYVGDTLTQTRRNIERLKTIEKKKAQIQVGNIVPIKNLPVGTIVFNIESIPMDGGKFARSSGVSANIAENTGKKVKIRFTSKKTKWLSGDCLATIGVVAGGGRIDKPFLKAGNKYHALKSKAKKWPIVRGTAMNACSHPHGGGAKQSSHKSTTISRNTPPGRKVGQIAARRTGHSN
jgi:large subunit ribosomal protein L2